MATKLYWIDLGSRGKLAVSGRPRGGDWLEDEIEAWRKEGINVVVSLLTPDELPELGLTKELDEARKRGMFTLNLPISDRGIPEQRAAAVNLVDQIHLHLESGKNVAIHCRQGIGRSGMIAAAVLVKAGVSPSEAIQRVSFARGLPTPETDEQKAWIFDFSPAAAPRAR